ncbi:unnamed protein product [Orchesella dallaii]|uniref:F-box domain-containing protein n=1 Tax=Orchesella dallaii TaxID=48710 RepID=A0ABP1S785_9HEXA
MEVDEEEILEKRIKLMEVKETPQIVKGKGKFLKSPKTNPVLFPENWEQIFKDLNPHDFLSVINTCGEWNELLHHKKTEILLPLVFPLILEYLPVKTIMKCRLINNFIFKRIVDFNLLQYSLNPDHLFEHDPHWIDNVNSIRSKVESVRSRYQLDRLEHLNLFLSRSESLSACGGNPFLTGNLIIELGREGIDGSDQGEALSLMLTRFGHHIISLRISLYNLIPGVTVPTLYSLLGKLPNLKDLHLNAMIPNDLVSSFNAEGLPPIPSLECICFMSFAARDIVNDVPLILPFLHRYGRQLKVFSCGGRLTGSRNFGVGFLNTLLPNLSHVKLNFTNPHSMMKLAMVTWKQLKMLRICGPTYRHEWNCKLVDVVRVVNNFKETLTTLELLLTVTFEGSQAVEKLEPEEMNEITNLRKLTTCIENLRVEWFWEFLKGCCGNLEELHFQILPNDPLPLEDKVGARRAFGFLSKLNRIVFWFSDKPKVVLGRKF